MAVNLVYMGAPSGGPVKPTATGTKVYAILHVAGGVPLSSGDYLHIDQSCTVEGTPVTAMSNGYTSASFIIPGEYDYYVATGQWVFDVTSLYLDSGSVNVDWEVYWLDGGGGHQPPDDQISAVNLLVVTGAEFSRVFVTSLSGSVNRAYAGSVLVWGHHGYWTSSVQDLSGPSWNTLLTSPIGSSPVGVDGHWYSAPTGGLALKYGSTTARRVIYALWFLPIEKVSVPLWALS